VTCYWKSFEAFIVKFIVPGNRVDNPYESPTAVDDTIGQPVARPIPSFVRYLVVLPCAWVCGLAAHCAALRFIWGQGLGGEAVTLVFWTGAAIVVTVPLLYLPGLNLVRWALGGYRPLWPFPVVAMLLGWVPIGLIIWQFGGGLRDFISPTSMLFFIMFSVFGLVLGTGFALRRRIEDR